MFVMVSINGEADMEKRGPINGLEKGGQRRYRMDTSMISGSDVRGGAIPKRRGKQMPKEL